MQSPRGAGWLKASRGVDGPASLDHSLIVQHHLPFGRELIECISLAATFDEACSK